MLLYDAFISYSHAKDKPVAAALQSAVQTLGKPWYRRRALRIFRDDTSLSATPHLWPSIEQALAQSRYLILLASPEAAASPWVNKEVTYWLDRKSADTLLIAVTDGALAWDSAAADFVRDGVNPLPPALHGRFATEPKWVDLTAYRAGADPRNADFTSLAADFAAAIHGMPKEDLLSQEVRQQRRALTLASSAAASMLVLTGLAGWQWYEAAVQRREAIAQRNRAEQTLTAATETANSLVTDLAVRLRNVTGIPSALVKDILERARRLQDQLIGSGETSLELRRSQSLALNEAATTLDTLGDTHEALAAARQAKAILESLTEAQPENTEWRRALAASHARIANALGKLGQTEEALAGYREGIAILQSLIATGVRNTQWQRELASGRANVGDMLRRQGKSEEALASYRLALDIRKELAAGDPRNRVWRLDLAGSYGSVGLVLSSQGRLEEALRYANERLAIAKALADEEPNDLSAQVALWRSYFQIGAIYKQQGKFEEALAAHREGQAVKRKRIAADKDDTEAQRSLVDSHQAIGEILVILRRYDEALAGYREANDIARALVAKDSTNVGWQRDLAVTAALIGDVLGEQNKPDEALAGYREAKEIFAALAGNDPTNTHWQISLSFVGYRIADVLASQRKFDEAHAAYRDSLRIAMDLAANDSTNLTRQHDVAKMHRRIGTAYRAQRRFEEALSALRAGKAIMTALTTKNLKNSWWLRDLAALHYDIGQVLFDLARYHDAVGSYRDSVAIFKALVAAMPNHPILRRELGLAVESLAISFLNTGRPQEALSYLDEFGDFVANEAQWRWVRARASIYGGQSSTAVDDLLALVKLVPANGYISIWLHIARTRAGAPDKHELIANAKKLDRGHWPWPMVAFFTGEESADGLMAAARSGAPAGVAGRVCEAEFYLAVDHLANGEHTEARRLLESAAQNCPRAYIEHAMAHMELKRLDGLSVSQAK